MSTESEAQRHYAMPRLMGAPGHVRRRHVEETPRPLHPDDLPLDAFRTDDERALAAALPSAITMAPASPEPVHHAVPSDAPAARGIARRLGFRR